MATRPKIWSIESEDINAIEPCPCIEDDDEDEEMLNQNSSAQICPNTWQPIIVYRKNKRNHQSRRCTIHQPRIIKKNGRSTDFIHLNINNRYQRYLRDLSNTMVNGRWRWVTLTLVLTFSLLWLLFGWLWMIIAIIHGDLDGTRNDTCTVGNEGFAGFLLMSIETQTTIGYGSRYPTENCAEGVFMLCLQMILSIGLEGAVLGVFYVKMTRPKIQDCRKTFSKIAVVCQRDGQLCLMFRASDKDRSHIVATQIRAYLTEKIQTEQGEHLEAFQKPLKLETFGLLLWPIAVVHKIEPESPLYDISAKDLLLKQFEIIVTMIGSSDSTGLLTQSRTSYLASEIYWGHRFRPCVHWDEELQSYSTDEELLSSTEAVDTPLCSAKRLDEVLHEIQVQSKEENTTSGISSLRSDPCSSPESLVNPTIHFEEILETDV